ncbi:hypothetical protein ACEWPL_016855 [Roseovarius sp. S1116L3]|uniref:hypothetical protein n=1 Tax=Roseovarius roseus TaxID=3342636 RepID=UPI003728AA69
MNDFNVIVALLGGATLFLGLGSRWLARTPFPPTLIALLLGILAGPQVFGLIDLEATDQRGDIMEKAAPLTLGIGLMGVASVKSPQ